MRAQWLFPACLAVSFAIGGCGFDSSTPFSLSEDRFEDDGDLDLASEDRLNLLAERRTIHPSEDVDYIRIRVNEPGVINDTDELPRFWFKPTVQSGSLRFDLWDERGMNTKDYDATNNFFKVPGIYYVRYSDAGSRGGAYRNEVRFWREASGSIEPWPDLTVNALDHSGGTLSFEPGASETFTIRIANQGSEDVGFFNYQVWLNDSGQPAPGTSIRTGTFSSLSMSAMFASDTFTVSSFPSTPKGPAYLVAKVDSSSAVSEGSYEHNNVLVVPVVVDAEGFTGWNVFAGVLLEVAGTYQVGPRRLLADWTETVGEGEEAEEITVRDVDELEVAFDASCPSMVEVWTSALHGGIRTTLELVDSLDVVLASKTSGHAVDGSAYMSFDHTALGGTPPYRVLVSDTSGRAGAYTLNFRVSDVADLGHFEPDGGPWTWRMLRANRSDEPLEHRRLSAEDEDWLAYGVRPEDALIVGDEGASRIHTIFVDPASHGVTLSLYRHSNLATPVLTGTDTITGTLPAGLYYLKVTGGPVGDTYKIKAAVTAPPPD